MKFSIVLLAVIAGVLCTENQADVGKDKHGIKEFGFGFGRQEGHHSQFENNGQELKTVTLTKEVAVPYPVVKEIRYPVKQIVEKPVPVPVQVPYKVPYTVPVEKSVFYSIPVEKKMPVPVKVKQPYPVPIEKNVQYPVPVKVPYPVKVENKVAVPIPVEKEVPYVVKVPIEQPVLHIVSKVEGFAGEFNCGFEGGFDEKLF